LTTALRRSQPGRVGRLRLVPPTDADGAFHAALREKGPEVPTGEPLATGPELAEPRLQRLLHRLGAARLALLRFERDGTSFEIVAAAGEPFLACGVRLPISASTYALAASEGRRALQPSEHSSRPLDRLAAALGLRCGMGIPLTVAGTPIGALNVLWDVDEPPVEDPCAALNGDHVDLVRMLVAPEPGRPTVLVCHEDRLVAEGVAHLAVRRLEARADVACTFADALSALAARPPDLIVLSDHLSPGALPTQTARRLRAAGAAAPILILAHSDSRQSLDSALQAGASGYLPLSAAAERLSETAATLLEGRTALHQPPTSPTVPRLTAREHQVLQCFERGLADKQIANELGVALSTVKTHARAIYAKLDATSRTCALHKARLMGLV
jgi:DNA-binding NarL/FixJ family response regulator